MELEEWELGGSRRKCGRGNYDQNVLSVFSIKKEKIIKCCTAHLEFRSSEHSVASWIHSLVRQTALRLGIYSTSAIAGLLTVP